MDWLDIVIPLLAILGGILAGMLGVGGGIIFVPIIQWYLSFHHIENQSVEYTLANSFVVIFVLGLVSFVTQFSKLKPFVISIIYTGISAVISSLILTFTFHHFKINNPIFFNIIFSIILLITLIKYLQPKEMNSLEIDANVENKSYLPIGFFAGIVTAISGLGGGIVMIPLFNKKLKLSISTSSRISLAVIPIIVLPLIIYYSLNNPIKIISLNHTGFLIHHLIIILVIGSQIGLQIGIKLSKILNKKQLTTIFILFVLITLVKTLILLF